MAGPHFSTHRFSPWDGSQDPLEPEAEELFGRLSEDVFHGWDFESALRRLLGQGWRDLGGRRMQGLEEMMEQLRHRRQSELERWNLEGVFSNIQEKLDRILRMERQALAARLADAGADQPSAGGPVGGSMEPPAPGGAGAPGRRVLERIVEQRRETLDQLPLEPAGAVRALESYEFLDAGAEQAFRSLLDELRGEVINSYFEQMSERLGSMQQPDIDQLRAMIHDLNALMRQRLEGVPAEQLQQNYQHFLSKWGRYFPDAPSGFDAFVEQLRSQLARMDSLMQSLSPQMRTQLTSLMESALQDSALQAELSQLGGAMELLSPRQRLGSRYSFFGQENMPLDEAMGVMGQLQSLEALERALRDAYRGEELDPAMRERVHDALGEDAARSLDQLAQVTRRLENEGLIQREGRGFSLTARGTRRIGQRALGDLFARLKRDRFGNHPLGIEGAGGERSDETKAYEFGDPFHLHVERTVMNSLRREAQAHGVASAEPPGRRVPRPPHLRAEDFEIHRSEATTRSSTVLMLDMSRSMPLRGYFYAAKKVALALDSLIRMQFPRDSLHIVGFSDYAREIAPGTLPQLTYSEYVYGTNMQHGLQMARRLLARHPGANRQIIIVSDGEPTAHMEGSQAVFFYPPLPETFHKTLQEVQRCTREGIVINTFMLESNYHLVQFVQQMTKLNRGRAFFISPDKLGDYILVDYVARHRGSRAA